MYILNGGVYVLSTTVAEWIMLALVVIIALTIHEFSHGLVSYIQGDKTPGSYGRLTLNPIAHIDPFGLVALFLFRFGWAKPVPINPKYYKHRRLGIILTSLAGPISNLLLMFIATLILLETNPQNSIITYFYQQFIFINASLAVFNMIPIPPLDGSKIFAELFGGKIAELIYRIEGKGTIILLLLIWFQPVNTALSNVIYAVVQNVANLAGLIVLHHTLF